MTLRDLTALMFACLMPMVSQAQTRLTVEAPSPEVVVFHISNSRFGSLEFDGAIERLDMGTDWEFRTRSLFATFHAKTKPNQTDRVELTAFRFVASNPRPDRPNGPADVIFEHSEAVAVHIDADGDRKAIPDVAFRVPKQAVAPAAFTGISVRSEGLVWPISVGVAKMTLPLPDRNQQTP